MGPYVAEAGVQLSTPFFPSARSLPRTIDEKWFVSDPESPRREREDEKHAEPAIHSEA